MKRSILFLLTVLNVPSVYGANELCKNVFAAQTQNNTFLETTLRAGFTKSTQPKLSIPESKLTEIESLRISELPYQGVKHALVRELRDLKLGVDENKLAEELLSYANHDKSASEIIANAVKPDVTGPQLSDAVVAEIESLRTSEILSAAAESQITRKLAAVGIENAQAVAKKILDYKNSSKSVREIITESTLSSATASPSRAEDLAKLILQTERLEIRAIGSDKAQEAFTVWGDPQTAKMSGDYFDLMTAQEILTMGQTRLDQAKNNPQPYLNFGIYEDGKIVGMAQVASGQEGIIYSTRKVLPGEKWVSISYHLKPSAWGKGIATEAAARLVKFAFETLNVTGLHAETIGSNAGSIAVLKKLGFAKIDVVGTSPGKIHFFIDHAMHEAKYHSMQNAVGQ